MAMNRDDEIAGGVGETFDRGTIAGQADGQILERFASHRDGIAFEALVLRHGPTVLGVCRRFLRDSNDADDAFQATFVILARKAGSLRDREALGPWLYGVANRVARRVRVDAERRRRRESPDDRSIALAQAPEAGHADLGWLIDEEILRLPEKLRLPVIHCLIEGMTYDEAARQLRWTTGMVRGRLAEARARLRGRLLRRGASPSVALGLGEVLARPVPGGLAREASRVVLGPVAGGAGPSSALALADRTLESWLMGKFGRIALSLIVAGLALGVGSASFRLLAHEPRGAPLAPGDARKEARQAPVVPPPTPRAPAPRRGSAGASIHPITIEGRALDPEGRPVAGAAIFVTDCNRSRPSGADEVLGRAVAGPDGRFALRDVALPVLPPEPGPIPRPTEGKFEVAGSAPGRGFTWHAVQSFRPVSPPTDAAPDEQGTVSYAGQPITADLLFGPPARIHGRIIDDRGRPVAGAKVQVGLIDNTRNPSGSGTWSCVAINPKGGDEPSFHGVGSLPEGVRSARTDADGRYSLDGLPREAKMLALIDQDPTLEPEVLNLATSTTPFPDVRSLGHDGVLDHTFVLPRAVPVRVALADSGRVASGVLVLAQGKTTQRAGASAPTDGEGLATLALRPGSYTLRIEPPFGLRYRVAEGAIKVGEGGVAEPLRFALEPGAPVILEAVVAETGEGLAEVGFDSAVDASADRREVASRPAFVDHPRTDESGKFEAVLDPGSRRFFPGHIPLGYESITRTSPVLVLSPDRIATARFEFRKVDRPARAIPPEEGEVGQKLRTTWEAQARLLRRGRMQASRTYQSGESIPPDRLRDLLRSLDRTKVPPILDLIAREFPDADAEHDALTMAISTDGHRRREDGSWAKRGPGAAPEVICFNGRETISYNPPNAQVDIYDNGPQSRFSLAVASPEDFCHWPRRAGGVVSRAGGRVTLESGSGRRIIADEATGFVYLDSRVQDDGSGDDVWQFAPRVLEHGAIVPGLSIEHRYTKDATSSIWIKAVESIDLHTPVPPETFLVSIPPGTQIRDYRDGRDDTYRGVARRPVTDVVALADADPRRHKPFVPPVQPGRPAPTIAPKTWVDGAGTIPAPDLAGKVVLVEFWGIWCGPCVAQLPEVREAARFFAGKDLILVGLHDSSGTPEAVAEFASKRGLAWPLAIDRPGGDGFGATFDAYGVRSIPAVAVIDRRGRLAFLGDLRGAIEKAATLLDEK